MLGLVSVINREYVLSKIFKDCNVHEVYADVNYTLELDKPNIAILTGKMEYKAALFNAVYSVYPNIDSCSITSNPKHPVLTGKKIIYRDGVWYV